MNVLPLVFSVLVLFGIVTYARFQNFTISKVVNLEYKEYCQNVQIKRGNDVQLALYDKQHCEKDTQGERQTPSNGIRKLDLSVLKEKEEKEECAFKKKVLKNLISTLFAHEPFLQEGEEKNPLIIEQAIEAMHQAIKEKKEVQGIDDISKIKFNTAELQEFWYFVLRDPSIEILEEDILAAPAYSSLKSNLTLTKPSPIRVYLASRELLLSLFEQEKTVDEILLKRKEIYKKLRQEDSDKDRLQQEFQTSFAQVIPNWVPPQQLSWDISKTNPS